MACMTKQERLILMDKRPLRSLWSSSEKPYAQNRNLPVESQEFLPPASAQLRQSPGLGPLLAAGDEHLRVQRRHDARPAHAGDALALPSHQARRVPVEKRVGPGVGRSGHRAGHAAASVPPGRRSGLLHHRRDPDDQAGQKDAGGGQALPPRHPPVLHRAHDAQGLPVLPGRHPPLGLLAVREEGGLPQAQGTLRHADRPWPPRRSVRPTCPGPWPGRWSCCSTPTTCAPR